MVAHRALRRSGLLVVVLPDEDLVAIVIQLVVSPILYVVLLSLNSDVARTRLQAGKLLPEFPLLYMDSLRRLGVLVR